MEDSTSKLSTEDRESLETLSNLYVDGGTGVVTKAHLGMEGGLDGFLQNLKNRGWTNVTYKPIQAERSGVQAIVKYSFAVSK